MNGSGWWEWSNKEHELKAFYDNCPCPANIHVGPKQHHQAPSVQDGDLCIASSAAAQKPLETLSFFDHQNAIFSAKKRNTETN